MKKKRKNYILVDFENVQPQSFVLPTNHEFKVIVFIGANQTKVPVELASTMQNIGSNAEYIQISGNGKNALDFHITFYLGKMLEKDPEGHFHIISKDTGFNVLIKHLRDKKASVYRHNDIHNIPIMTIKNVIKTTKSHTKNWSNLKLKEQSNIIVDHLIKRDQAKPKKYEGLFNTINSLSSRSLDSKELHNIINFMKQKKLISINDEKITYKL